MFSICTTENYYNRGTFRNMDKGSKTL